MHFEDVKERKKLKFSSQPEENLFLQSSSDSFLLTRNAYPRVPDFYQQRFAEVHYFATLSENVTIISDAFIDMSSYFDFGMSNLRFAA